MIHWITPDFPTSFSGGETFRLRLNPAIFDLIVIRELLPVRLQFSDIRYRDLSVNEAGIRYATANTAFPGIVLDDNGYRLVDGRHRIKKLMSSGQTSGMFYILKDDDIKPFLERITHVNTGH